MDEFKCPKCGWGFTAERQTIGVHDVIIIRCKEYGHFLGVINDMSKIKANIEAIDSQFGITRRL